MIEIENDSVETSYQVIMRYPIEYRQGYYTRKWPFSKSRGIFFQGEGIFFESTNSLPYFLSHLFHLYEQTRTIHHLTHIFLSRIQPSSPSTGNHIEKLRMNKKTECFEYIKKVSEGTQNERVFLSGIVCVSCRQTEWRPSPNKNELKKEKPIFLKLSKKKRKSTNFTFRASLIDPPKKRISWEKQVVCEIISTTRFPEGGKMKSKWLEGIQMKKKNKKTYPTCESWSATTIPQNEKINLKTRENEKKEFLREGW